jgi:hypothetical protein
MYVVTNPMGDRTRPVSFEEASVVVEQWAIYGCTATIERVS